MSDPFAYTSGPRDAKVMLVGEAWGADEARSLSPFSGPSGKELDKMLFDAGFARSNILCTNVIDKRPEGNEFSKFLYTNAEAKAQKLTPVDGLHPKPELIAGLRKLDALIEIVKPKLIIGCGNVPLWALTDKAKTSSVGGTKLPSGIMNYRGSQLWHKTATGTNIPYLPIIHPATILRSWDLRFPTVHDLRTRASRFMQGELEWKEPVLHSIHKPTTFEAIHIMLDWLKKADKEPLWLACDIETYRRSEIAVIGFSDDKLELCIPFFYFDSNGVCVDYFNAEDELWVTNLIRQVLTHPNIKIIGQNYKYDFQFMYRKLGIRSNFNFDTMLAHHLLWPGTPKSLDYLASLYSPSYVYWKDESQDWDTDLSHEDMWKYNCKDLRHTYNCWIALTAAIKQLGMEEQYQCQLDQWHVTADMEIDGVPIDREARNTINLNLIRAYNELERYLVNAMPPDLQYTGTGKPWFTSPTVTMDIFYRVLGLPEQINRKTKKPSTDAQSLDALKKKAAWMQPILNRLDTIRSISVFRSHFIEAKLSRDGNIRCSYNIGGTETFRWSSNLNPFDEGTNLQNIPKGDEG